MADASVNATRLKRLLDSLGWQATANRFTVEVEEPAIDPIRHTWMVGQSKAILEPLHRITRRYKGLKLDGDRLVVADPYHDYSLSDLSTGAQEQILLALRIGFSTRLLKQESLFLILDDAFQYSDWERRDWLLDMMVDLARSGWQIIYFTMDDHIRDLFEKKGKAFGKGFHSAVLTDSQA